MAKSTLNQISLLLICLIAGLFPRIARADIPHMAFLQVKITRPDAKEIRRYLSMPDYRFSMDSIYDDAFAKRLLTTAWIGRDSFEVYRHWTEFTGIFGHRIWDSIPQTIYGVAGSELLSIHDVQSVHVERVEFNGGGQGIFNELAAKDSVWMKKEPLRVTCAGVNNYFFTIFQFEKSRKVDTFILDLIAKGIEATRKGQDLDISDMLVRIKRKRVVIIWSATC